MMPVLRLPPVTGLVLLLMQVGAAPAEVRIEKIGDSVVDTRALVLGDPQYGRMKFGAYVNGCTGQQEAVLTHHGFQYVGYYDGDRRVCLARRKLPSGDWQVIRFQDYLFKNNDTHNFISIGACPGDGTIHMAFDHHAHVLHYRVSRQGAADNPESVTWDASLFGPVRSELAGKTIAGVTYPRFFATPEGKLQMTYRVGASGGGDMIMHDYDPDRGTWSGPRRLDSGQGVFTDAFGSDENRCSYPNGYTYDDQGRLHVAWVWRESSQASTNHDLMYAYSDDRGNTWFSDAGREFPLPARVDTPGITALNIPRNSGLANGSCQAADSRGRIHVILRHHLGIVQGGPPGAQPSTGKQRPPSGYFHYWRQGPGQWAMNTLPVPGATRPKLFMDPQDNALMITQSGGNLLILRATADTQWQDWRLIHTEKGPFPTEMVADPVRWKRDGVLSVLVQERSPQGFAPSPLRIIDFKVRF